jgi:hypothetical protein
MQGALNEGDRHDRDPAVGRKSIETPSGSHQQSRQPADYYPLIFQAVSRLDSNTAETRGRIYDRARAAMLVQLRGSIPSLTESDIGREQLALEESIKKAETESLHHLRPTLPSMPHRPSSPVNDVSHMRAVVNDCGARTTAVRFYVSDDVENDVRRCIRSWEHQNSISVTGRAVTGEIKCFSGTVEAVARAPGLATGELWLVTMRELEPASGLFDAGIETAAFSNALSTDLRVDRSGFGTPL